MSKDSVREMILYLAPVEFHRQGRETASPVHGGKRDIFLLHRLRCLCFLQDHDLYNAILTREPIDLIDLSGVNIESLLRQGILEDLLQVRFPYRNL